MTEGHVPAPSRTGPQPPIAPSKPAPAKPVTVNVKGLPPWKLLVQAAGYVGDNLDVGPPEPRAIAAAGPSAGHVTAGGVMVADASSVGGGGHVSPGGLLSDAHMYAA